MKKVLAKVYLIIVGIAVLMGLIYKSINDHKFAYFMISSTVAAIVIILLISSLMILLD